MTYERKSLSHDSNSDTARDSKGYLILAMLTKKYLRHDWDARKTHKAELTFITGRSLSMVGGSIGILETSEGQSTKLSLELALGDL
ncbi:hypothetical protein BGX26_000459 [Mortierella sp. AD094]|nr:hypothetical protein BGX26_000459 [Mortierella sp. AD094]